MDYNGFMDRPSRNESEYQRWIWVVDRVVHYMLLWSIMGDPASNFYKMVVDIQGAYKMDPAGTRRNI